MKRLFALFCVSLLLLCSFGCRDATEQVKITLVTMNHEDAFWLAMDEGCKKAAAESNRVTYCWIAPEESTVELQTAAIQQAVDEGADAILLAASFTTELEPILTTLDEKGIPLIYVDSPAEHPALQTIATDNFNAGRKAAKEMQDALSDLEIQRGFIGIISANGDTESTNQRDAGFREAFADTSFTLLPPRYSGGDIQVAANLTEELLSIGCVGIFATNESTSTGLAQGMHDKDSSAVAIGFDHSPTIENEILNGNLYCTMAQNPEVMGYSGLKAALSALDGISPGAKRVDTGVSVLNREALEQTAEQTE